MSVGSSLNALPIMITNIPLLLRLLYLIFILGNYFKNILDDYKTVGVETLQDMKDRPVKSAFYLSLLGGAIFFAKKNPSEEDFMEQLTNNMNELMLVGDPIRNPISDGHMQTLRKAYNTGEMRYLNLLFFSIMWRDNYHRRTDLYKAQCKPLKVGWLDLPDRTLDIGVLGKWWWVEKAMIDYDINPNEWPIEQASEKK